MVGQVPLFHNPYFQYVLWRQGLASPAGTATVLEYGTRVRLGKSLGHRYRLLLCFIRFRRFLAMSNWLRRLLLIWAVTACLPLFAQEFRAGITGIVNTSQSRM